MMQQFLKELRPDELHIRDSFQFEIQSECSPNPQEKLESFQQEFYIFVPKSLQINTNTFSSDDFFRQQTLFVGFSPPSLSLKDYSLFEKLSSLLKSSYNEKVEKKTVQTLKLLGYTFRCALKERIVHILEELDSLGIDPLNIAVLSLCKDIVLIHNLYVEQQKICNPSLQTDFRYIDEFLSVSTDYYLTGLLHQLKARKCTQTAEKEICKLLINEKHYRNIHFKEPLFIDQNNEEENEAILHRRKLLNKYVAESTQINTSRKRVISRYYSALASLSAGIAMLVYLVLFNRIQNPTLLMNSSVVLFTSVILYMLKDRLKDAMKTLFHKHGARLFPDYVTKISSPPTGKRIGILKESFAFISQVRIPREISDIRNTEFHRNLELFQRPETVLYYKSDLKLRRNDESTGLHSLFRFNIFSMLAKAGEPYHVYAHLDPRTLELKEHVIPKIYHMNIIIREQHNDTINFKKYRVIIDKLGIKRVEKISNMNGSFTDKILDGVKFPVRPLKRKTPIR